MRKEESGKLNVWTGNSELESRRFAKWSDGCVRYTSDVLMYSSPPVLMKIMLSKGKEEEEEIVEAYLSDDKDIDMDGDPANFRHLTRNEGTDADNKIKLLVLM